MSKRPRTESARRENADFIDACVNFRTNFSFTDLPTHTAQNPDGLPTPFVVLMGTRAELQDASVCALPFYTAALAEVLRSAREETATLLLVDGVRNALGSPFVRLVLALVPSRASRTNCPARPDAMTRLMRLALAQFPAGAARVDVFVRALAATPVAAALARGGARVFSAKSDISARGDVCVVFPRPPTPHAETLTLLATHIQLCQCLLDAPASLLDTAAMEEIARGRATDTSVRVECVNGEALRQNGYGGLYAVGKAAMETPRLLTLTYTPSNHQQKECVALVGKGIVYDCGGLALKAASFMVGMKHDMGGAAAVLCGFLAAVALRVPCAMHAVLCLAENAIGPNAYRNDDILRLKSGKTVEVNNTDAEGRIVLADGVFHATHLLSPTPTVLIDMATLTGAQGIATGRKHAAIYANDAQAEEDILRAGRQCGDTCFPVLYCPEYHAPEFNSVHADMRNLMEQPNNASVSCAGHFVESHLSPNFKGKHIHVDLAFPAFDKDGGTGFGVALLLEYMKAL